MIRSLTGTSLIEYPGKICSIIFIGGCNLYCPFCHNPELVRPDLLEDEYGISHEEVLRLLEERTGFIEAVCITGGEPLIYAGLEDLIADINTSTDLSVKLDTNGTLPRVLEDVIGYVDYMAMDLKSSPSKYYIATGEKACFDDVRESIELIRNLPEHEFRTTMVPGIVDGDDIVELLKETGPLKKYVLQRFYSQKTLSPEFTDILTYPQGYIEDVAARITELGLASEVAIRM